MQKCCSYLLYLLSVLFLTLAVNYSIKALMVLYCRGALNKHLRHPSIPSTRLRPVTTLRPLVQLMSLRASQSQTVCLQGTKTPVASLLSPTRQLNKPVQHNSSDALLPHTSLCRPPSPCLSLIKMTHALLDRQRPAQH